MKEFPTRIILGTEDILRGYNSRTYGLIHSEDLTEVVTQVIQLLLNADPEKALITNDFPNFKRLKNRDFLNDTENNIQVTEETIRLVWIFQTRLKEMGVYCDNTMSYFFDGFLDKDIILGYLPF